MQNKIVFVFITIVSMYNQACLSQIAIQGLGFTTALNGPEVRSGSSYCKGLYDTDGACVNDTGIETILSQAKWGIAQFMDMQWYAISIFEDFKTDNQLLQMGIDLLKTTITNSGISESLMNRCKRDLQILKFGSLCYLTSGNASQKSTLNGTQIQFEVLESVSKQKENCYEYFSKFCKLQTQFNNFSEGSTEDQMCTNINNVPTCNGADCTARYQSMNQVIDSSQIPLSTEGIYNTTMDALKQQLEVMKQQLEAQTTSQTTLGLMNSVGRRLQQQATYTYQMKVSSSGVDAYTYGEDSGEKPTSSLMLLNIFVSFITVLFL